MSGRYRATYRSDPRNVATARHAVANFARSCGFDQDEVAEIALATGEALSNAAEHGLTKQGGSFFVQCEFVNDALVVEIRDTGRGFVAKERPTEPIPSRGFGMTIMRALMNEIRFSQNGTQVQLVRRRGQSAQNGEGGQS